MSEEKKKFENVMIAVQNASPAATFLSNQIAKQMLNEKNYSQTSLNRPTMRLSLNGTFREVVGLGS